jgi:hypothetical protein
MKTGSAGEFAVPDLLVPYLVTYLDIIRPRMLRRPSCRALWVSRKGGVLSYSAIWPIVARHSRQRLGLHLAPHGVRHAAAPPGPSLDRHKLMSPATCSLMHTLARPSTTFGEAGRADAKRIGDIRKGR